jgi:hypothetical protein
MVSALIKARSTWQRNPVRRDVRDALEVGEPFSSWRPRHLPGSGIVSAIRSRRPPWQPDLLQVEGGDTRGVCVPSPG